MGMYDNPSLAALMGGPQQQMMGGGMDPQTMQILMALLGGPQATPLNLPAAHVPGASGMGGGMGAPPQQQGGDGGMGAMTGGLEKLMPQLKKLFGGSGGGSATPWSQGAVDGLSGGWNAGGTF